MEKGSDDILARLEQVERRLALLERAVRSYGIPVPHDNGPGDPQPSAAVVALVHRGKKMDAIKVLVQETGLGLKEAKDIVDRL